MGLMCIGDMLRGVWKIETAWRLEGCSDSSPLLR